MEHKENVRGEDKFGPVDHVDLPETHLMKKKTSIKN